MIDSRGYALETVDPEKLEKVKFASEAANDNNPQEIQVVIDEFYAGLTASLAEEALPKDDGTLRFGEPNCMEVIERIEELEKEYMGALTDSQKSAIASEIVRLSEKIHYSSKEQEYDSYRKNLCV